MSGGAGQLSMATTGHGEGFDTMGHHMLIDFDKVRGCRSLENQVERDGRIACTVRYPAP